MHRLQTLTEEYKRLNVQIVVVSFGSAEGACLWKADTECTHPIVLDISRKIYHAMGLRTSFSAVWSTSTMRYYAFQKQQGKNPIKPYQNVQDDPLQLGGDCILYKDGRVVMSHPQKDPTDRPSNEFIVNSITSFCK